MKYVNNTVRIMGKAYGEENIRILEGISSPMDAVLAHKLGVGRVTMSDLMNSNVHQVLDKATLTLREQSPLYQYILLNKYQRLNNTWMSFEVSHILEDGLKAKSLRLHHSEENQCMSNLLMGNCRDTKLEKCIDSVVVAPYLLKFNYAFSKTPSDSATMFTFYLSRTMGLCNSDANVKNTSIEFASLKNAVTDNESLIKNCIRFMRLYNRCNDAVHQVTPATCTCPFTLHHSPTTGGVDEFQNPQIINYDNDFSLTEIPNNPYVANQMRAMKNFTLQKSKIDPPDREVTLSSNRSWELPTAVWVRPTGTSSCPTDPVSKVAYLDQPELIWASSSRAGTWRRSQLAPTAGRDTFAFPMCSRHFPSPPETRWQTARLPKL